MRKYTLCGFILPPPYYNLTVKVEETNESETVPGILPDNSITLNYVYIIYTFT